jgi:hypothetical protein
MCENDVANETPPTGLVPRRYPLELLGLDPRLRGCNDTIKELMRGGGSGWAFANLGSRSLRGGFVIKGWETG